jgi:hypothetical protein
MALDFFKKNFGSFVEELKKPSNLKSKGLEEDIEGRKKALN